jgi:hypothetical protein
VHPCSVNPPGCSGRENRKLTACGCPLLDARSRSPARQAA